jgi:hypothetical protein
MWHARQTTAQMNVTTNGLDSSFILEIRSSDLWPLVPEGQGILGGSVCKEFGAVLLAH